jgi:hypothetical protein
MHVHGACGIVKATHKKSVSHSPIFGGKGDYQPESAYMKILNDGP